MRSLHTAVVLSIPILPSTAASYAVRKSLRFGDPREHTKRRKGMKPISDAEKEEYSNTKIFITARMYSWKIRLGVTGAPGWISAN
ncbi:hypothetical protein FRC12_014832 [Ceratobasidium sp. 428]|nr:hypothetical protein FRC12_014832 [Ceratobasidium sp. 428]